MTKINVVSSCALGFSNAKSHAKKMGLGAVFGVGILLATGSYAAAQQKTLNIFNWSDYIGPDVIKNFEKETGIKVNYDATTDNNETIETKLQAGGSNYDIAVPTLNLFGARGIAAGLYQKIDKTKLKNYGNIDPNALAFMAKSGDPGNEYAVPWVMAIDAIGYNVQKIHQIMPDAPTTSLKMLFDPAVVSKFKSCGIMFLDSPTDVIPMALFYLGRDPNSENPKDLEAVGELLMKIRPYIRKFDSSAYIDALAAGDICLALGFSTDIALAGKRAKEAGKKFEVKLQIPSEGSQSYVDSLMIPKGAKNIDAAYQFIDYVLRGEVSAETSNFIGARTANLAAMKFLKPEIANNPGLFPSADVQKSLYSVKPLSKEATKARTRLWTKIKTRQK